VETAARLTVGQAESLSLFVRDERRRDAGLTTGDGLSWAEAANELEATCAALDDPQIGRRTEAEVVEGLRSRLPEAIGTAARGDVVLAAVRAAQAERLRGVLEPNVASALQRPWLKAVDLGRSHPERVVPRSAQTLPWGWRIMGRFGSCMELGVGCGTGIALLVVVASIAWSQHPRVRAARPRSRDGRAQ
jgi:hypothetical protein